MQLVLEGLRRQIDEMVPRVKQVIKQTRARIFRGNTRSDGKLLSLFEPSTEVIRKGKAGKPNEFGKMVKLQEAENQIVIDYEVYARRPNDSDILIAAIDTHRALLGRAPRLVAADAAFYSNKNEAAAKEKILGHSPALVSVLLASELICSASESSAATTVAGASLATA